MTRTQTAAAIVASALTATVTLVTVIGVSTPALAAKAPNNQHRPEVPNNQPRPGALAPQYSFSGEGNNVANPAWGSVSSGFIRTAPPSYSDGVSAMSGTDRPSARIVSNSISDQTESIINNRNLTDMVYVFGQFLDHFHLI